MLCMQIVITTQHQKCNTIVVHVKTQHLSGMGHHEILSWMKEYQNQNILTILNLECIKYDPEMHFKN